MTTPATKHGEHSYSPGYHSDRGYASYNRGYTSSKYRFHSYSWGDDSFYRGHTSYNRGHASCKHSIHSHACGYHSDDRGYNSYYRGYTCCNSGYTRSHHNYYPQRGYISTEDRYASNNGDDGGGHVDDSSDNRCRGSISCSGGDKPQPWQHPRRQHKRQQY